MERLKSRTAIALIASLMAALGVGGIALAQNSGGGDSHQAAARDAETNDGPDANEANDPSDANEATDSETADAPGDDGGHTQTHEAEDGGSDQGEQ
jgi:hypothetical protein